MESYLGQIAFRQAATFLVCLVFIPFSAKDADLLDVESKHFEDLEFQQLEHESRLDEEKENLTQQLLREVAEYQRNIVTRKVYFKKLRYTCH